MDQLREIKRRLEMLLAQHKEWRDGHKEEEMLHYYHKGKCEALQRAIDLVQWAIEGK